MRRTLEDVRVVPVETALQLDRREPPVAQCHHVVMPIGIARGLPAADEATVLQEVKDVLHKLALFAHRRGELTPHALDGPSEQATLVEIPLSETVVAQLMGLRLEGLGEAHDHLSEAVILIAGNRRHAADSAASTPRSTGSTPRSTGSNTW